MSKYKFQIIITGGNVSLPEVLYVIIEMNYKFG